VGGTINKNGVRDEVQKKVVKEKEDPEKGRVENQPCGRPEETP